MDLSLRLASLILLILFSLCQCGDHYQEQLVGSVGSGNYSYYWLPQPGTVYITLHSIQGDADVYVSSSIKNMKPTFDVEEHEFQSTTCGMEHILIHSGHPRPLSIAIYGHPSHELSVYELQIDVYEGQIDKNQQDEVSSNGYNSDVKQNHQNKPNIPSLPVKDDPEYEERSVFWTLLLHVLQVVLDLLVD